TAQKLDDADQMVTANQAGAGEEGREGTGRQADRTPNFGHRRLTGCLVRTVEILQQRPDWPVRPPSMFAELGQRCLFSDLTGRRITFKVLVAVKHHQSRLDRPLRTRTNVES